MAQRHHISLQQRVVLSQNLIAFNAIMANTSEGPSYKSTNNVCNAQNALTFPCLASPTNQYAARQTISLGHDIQADPALINISDLWHPVSEFNSTRWASSLKIQIPCSRHKSVTPMGWRGRSTYQWDCVGSSTTTVLGWMASRMASRSQRSTARVLHQRHAGHRANR